MNENSLRNKIKYFFYTMSHPMDGFYWIRHKDRGSVLLAIILVALFSFSFTLNRLHSGFVVNEIDKRGVDSFYELVGILAFYLILCVSNWSITCLMNGEGRLKDIAIAIGYGTFPITVGMIVTTLFSHFLAEGEQVFYTLVLGICIAYGILLILMGIMQVHNYTLGKTLLTVLLTFIAFLIIVFLLLLLSNLIGAVINFFVSVYREIIFKA
ncbi:MAG: YIP1 family protein [Lachnospiraceae bacterium]|nr:YIP1 family protein [Lachnospiraceae bacterium]